ncbi:MAG TPA: hypothetical protein VNJ28_04605 [Candidatus Limnocylindrales bacterium]|jgi:hypothetical protein|nr:hypothetical protein [Candidatus Limnocylindrales bacterium]
MLDRSISSPTAVSRRSTAMRRLRRRTTKAQRLYCATNGCTTFLVVDVARGVATCPVCGYRRRLG